MLSPPARLTLPAALLLVAAVPSAAAQAPGDYRLDPYEPYQPCLRDDGTQCVAYEVLDTVLVGDLTGDGRDDVFTVPVNNELWVIPQRPDGTLAFDARREFNYGNDGYSHVKHFVLGDFNEDGALDVAGNRSEQGLAMNVLLSDGAGDHTLEELPVRAPFANEWQYPFATDVDRDGHLDVVVYAMHHDEPRWDSPYGTYAYVQYGDGTGQFPRMARFRLVDDGVTRLEMGDFDGDGNDDVAMCVSVGFPGDPRLAVGYHDGGAGYGAASVTDIACYDVLATGDFNGDTQDEITTWIPGDHRMMALSIPTPAQASFEPMVQPANIHPYTVLAADLNGDGRVDLYSHQFVCSVGCSWVFAAPYLNLVDGWTDVAGPVPPDESSRVPGNEGYGTRQFAAGDVDSDGCTDVVTAHGHDGLAIHRGRDCMPPTGVPRDDYNGDGLSDVIWRHATGANAIWLAADFGSPQPMTAVRNPGWDLVATGDFDGDGVSDVFWRHRVSGANAIWPRAVPGKTPVTTVTRTDWRVVGAGDFDGDGRDDIFWRDVRSGYNALWPTGHMGNASVTAVLNTDWKVAGIGDFDGDGRADLLWRNPVTGQNVIWRKAEYADQQAVAPAEGDWTVAGIGNFDGDLVDDIFWRHRATGANVAWLGGSSADTLPVTDVTNLDWGVARVADYDGDGRADVLWRNARSGANVLWNAADYGRQRGVATVGDQAWQAVPGR